MSRLTARVIVAILGVEAAFGCDLAQLEQALDLYPHAQVLHGFRCYREVPGASAYLAGVLEDARRVQSWPMAVAVLGAIGDEESYAALVSFLADQRTTGPHGRMTRVEFTSKVDAITMIDYLRRYSAQDSLRQRAATLLRALASPEGWQSYRWSSPEHESRAQGNAYLASKTRFALQRRTPGE